MNARPLREVIATPLDKTFLAHDHDYPFCHDHPFVYTGWHYHPEFEIHLVQRSSGVFYAGTYSGRFGPNNLIMTGPNLPHMWVTDTDDPDFTDGCIKRRDVVIQFNHNFIQKCVQGFTDCASLTTLLEKSHTGISFSDTVAAAVAPKMSKILEATGIERFVLFLQIIDLLSQDKEKQLLSLTPPENLGKQTTRLNSILAYIAENYNVSSLSCSHIADQEGMGLSAFSRFFERHVKCSCLDYLNRLRIYKSCQLLAETDNPITTICYDVGYNSLSTFNRNFSRYVGVSPSEFRIERRFSKLSHTG